MIIEIDTKAFEDTVLMAFRYAVGRHYTHNIDSPYYLKPLFDALKQDYSNTHNGIEWREYMQV